MIRRIIQYSAIFIVVLFLSGCAARTYLTVGYAPPPVSGQLAGQTVRLEVKDLRTDGATLTPSAAGALRGFRDRYRLAWVAGRDRQVAAGTHNLANLFAEAFRKRLTLMGAVVVGETRPDIPLITVAIGDFTIDSKDRRWIVRAAYKATLSIESGRFADETVTGSAERLRIMGREGSDELTGEIFTEIVNRLDIAKLFRQTGLI
jgi:hypothetical protein